MLIRIKEAYKMVSVKHSILRKMKELPNIHYNFYNDHMSQLSKRKICTKMRHALSLFLSPVHQNCIIAHIPQVLVLGGYVAVASHRGHLSNSMMGRIADFSSFISNLVWIFITSKILFLSKKGPIEMGQHRPISCLNCLYCLLC